MNLAKEEVLNLFKVKIGEILNSKTGEWELVLDRLLLISETLNSITADDSKGLISNFLVQNGLHILTVDFFELFCSLKTQHDKDGNFSVHLLHSVAHQLRLFCIDSTGCKMAAE